MKRRFFFHYNKPESAKAGTPKLSVHYKGTCFIVDHINCHVPTQSKIRSTQPRVVMQGFAEVVDIKDLDGTVVATIL